MRLRLLVSPGNEDIGQKLIFSLTSVFDKQIGFSSVHPQVQDDRAPPIHSMVPCLASVAMI